MFGARYRIFAIVGTVSSEQPRETEYETTIGESPHYEGDGTKQK